MELKAFPPQRCRRREGGSQLWRAPSFFDHGRIPQLISRRRPRGRSPARPTSRRCRAVADPLPERARLTAGPLMAHRPALISTTAAIEDLDVVGLLNERHESAGLSR